MHWHPVLRGRAGAGRIVGAEALVRWQHPERGLLLHEDFVPLAEESGLIRAIGEWTLERTLSQAGAWQRTLPAKLWFAVNVSSAELAQGEVYFERVRESLKANGIEGAQVELEVTERTLMTHFSESAEILDDPVVNYRDAVGAVGVRMRVAFVRLTVGRPPGVRDANAALNGMHVDEAFEHRDLALRLSSLEPVTVAHGDAG